ncbi:MAG TPA: hypothetical protein VLJ41_13900 [Segetibacter sp.]|nr:hypothetical protein [Segetibacter sp.]
MIDLKKLEEVVSIISKGDTSIAEKMLNKPGGRIFLECSVSIILSHLPYEAEDREALFIAFIKTLNKIEGRIRRQHEGQEILKQVYI